MAQYDNATFSLEIVRAEDVMVSPYNKHEHMYKNVTKRKIEFF